MRNQPCPCGSGRPRHLCCDPPRTLVDVFTPLGGQIRQALTSPQTVRKDTDPAARAHAHKTVQRALALRRAGKLAEALPAFREAIALTPDNGLLHHDFGLCLVQLGRFAEAVVPLQQAAALKPNFAEAYYQLGFALQALRDTTKPKWLFATAVMLGAARPSAWRVRPVFSHWRKITPRRPILCAGASLATPTISN
jgi:tetratricopeptide (TPR) repeat protein